MKQLKPLLYILLLTSVITVKAQETTSFTDSRNGKTYKTVKIGEQVWMAENLAYEIPSKQITDNTAWESNSTYDAWCYHNNDKTTYVDKYGILYQWEVAKNACPDGWHLPSNEEWTKLITYISNDKNIGVCDKWDGSWSEIGKILRSKTGWDDNGNGTDDYGFTAVPSGSRRYGMFYNNKLGCNWWSSTEYDKSYAYCRYLFYDNNNIKESQSGKESGFSVRCVKD